MSETPKNTEADSKSVEAPEMTRRGAQFLDTLNKLSVEEKQERMERWKVTGNEPEHSVNKLRLSRLRRTEKCVPYVEMQPRLTKQQKRHCHVNRTLLKTLITDKKWKDISPRIRHYHEELDQITARLKEEGKHTGCAKAYKAKIEEQLSSGPRNYWRRRAKEN